MTPGQWAAAWEDQQLGAALGYLFLALAVIGYLCLDFVTRRQARDAMTTLDQLRAVCRRKETR
jgi:hypothetical protein